MSDELPKDIFKYVKDQEILYSQEFEVVENWWWNMKEHIRTAILFKHGKFKTADNKLETKNPNKNIVLPLLNLRYRAEDIDMKDIQIFVNDQDKYHLSFLIKKYHDEVYVRDNDLDTFFDEAKEEKIDYGGVLTRKGPNGPVLEPLDSIAFCDQTDIMSGPIAFKIFLSPDELMDMAQYGWGKPSNGATATLEEVITLAEQAKLQDAQKGRKTKTPSKYVEVYRVHGVLPAEWLSDKQTDTQKETFVRQLQIIAYYKNKEGMDKGVVLYRKKEYENPFKFNLPAKKIRNRALAYGGIEELLDPQIWTNYSEIHKKQMLDAASKVTFQTSDEGYVNRNEIKNMENMQVTVTAPNTKIEQIPNASPNINLFTEYTSEWNEHAQTTSGSTPALMGQTAPGSSGRAFRMQAALIQQAQALHDYRRGKFATFIAEIYQDWIIPDIISKLNNGVKFLATLSTDELEYVADCVVRNQTNKFVIDNVLNGNLLYPEDIEAFRQKTRDEFHRKGNKHFLEILKGEFDDLEVSVKVDVANKQKDLPGLVDKYTKLVQFIFSTFNPQTGKFAAFDDPRIMKFVQKMLEYSDLDPVDLGYANQQQPQPQPGMMQAAMPQPMQQRQPQSGQPQPTPLQAPSQQPMMV